MPLAAVAGIGAIGSIAGGIIGSNAAGHAADTQAAAANHAADLERQSAVDALNFNKQQYGNSLSLLSPFYNTGVSANGRLAYLMGLNPAQGLPPGVINPNATQGTGGGVPGTAPGNGYVPGIGPVPSIANGGPDIRPFQADGNIPFSATINRLRALQGNSAMLQPGQNPTQGNPGAPSTLPNPDAGRFNSGNQVTLNPPITSPGTSGGFQMNPPITSGGTGGAAGMLNPDGTTTQDFNPGPQTLSVNPTNATTNQGGTGQVPRMDGETSFNMNPPNIPQGEGGFGFPGQGSPSNPSGGFGSLAQGWNQTFQSPTGVTEQNDPGYQFRLAQGQQALQNSAAAKGGLLSGGTAKALNDYAQGSASQEYGNVYNRALQNYNTNYNTFTNDQTNLFNRLQALQSGGQVAANNLSASGITAANNAANIGLTSAGQIGQQINNAGAANASGYVNSANAINGAIGGATNSLSTLALLRQLQGGGAGSSSGGMGVF